MLVIGFDPGKCSGYGVLRKGKRIESGTWLLLGGRDKKDQDEPKELVYPRVNVCMRKLVDKYIESDGEVLLAYERVMSHGQAGVYAAHMYGGLIAAAVHLVAHSRPTAVTIDGIGVGTWKKLALGDGKGKAKQAEYIKGVKAHFRITRKTTIKHDQDEFAALGIALAGWKRYCGNS